MEAGRVHTLLSRLCPFSPRPRHSRAEPGPTSEKGAGWPSLLGRAEGWPPQAFLLPLPGPWDARRALHGASRDPLQQAGCGKQSPPATAPRCPSLNPGTAARVPLLHHRSHQDSPCRAPSAQTPGPWTQPWEVPGAGPPSSTKGQVPSSANPAPCTKPSPTLFPRPPTLFLPHSPPCRPSSRRSPRP